MTEPMFPWSMEYAAQRLHFEGKDPIRAVVRLFKKHSVPYLVRGNKQLVTEAQWRLLLARMEECSKSENEEESIIAGVRSESGRKSASSKSTVQALIEKKLPTSIAPDSNPKSDKNSFTVMRGGLG